MTDLPVPSPTRILLVDDHAIARQEVRRLIESQPGLHMVGEAQDRAGALPLASREQPDVILLDLDLGRDNGLDLMGDLLAAAPNSRILVLTGVRDTQVHRRAIHLGAAGIVERETAAEVLVKAIGKVIAGEVWLDRTTMASIMAEMSRAGKACKNDAAGARIATLSVRELEVAALIGEGLSNKRIAERLFISETTVRHHLTSIFSKLGVHDRLELLLYAYRYKILEPPAP